MAEGDLFESIPKPPKAAFVFTQVTMCIMPFTQVVMGAMYLHDCPDQPNIPIYLIVMGVLSLLLTVLSILPCNDDSEKCCMALSCLLSVFIFCWFIAGNVWINSIYEPNYNISLSAIDGHSYCTKTLYLFAFWTTTMFYIMLGFFIVCTCYSAVLVN